MTDDTFTVDVDELLHVVRRMGGCESRLRDVAAELQRRIDDLHTTWNGEAATAHVAAQAEWTRGFREMHDALGRMRAAADTARHNYSCAADTNLRLWEQVG